MTVFDSRVSRNVRILADKERTPTGSTNQVGWVDAVVWPTVWTAVVAGALLGSAGDMLLWAGIVGVAGMVARQGAKIVARNVRQANLIIDNAPTGPSDF